MPSTTGPVSSGERITNLDAIRGFAVLGILVMNAVSYGLPMAAYFNLDAQPDQNWLDWIIGGLGEVFVDQKTMGLFSMLFGAGIVLFAERSEAKGKRVIWFSLWRNLLLLGIGLLHGLIWEGDILFVYAICSPVLIAMRRLKPRALLVGGAGLVAVSALVAIATQPSIDAAGTGLGGYWFADLGDSSISEPVGIFLYVDFFARSLGMMMIGVAAFRLGIFHGTRSRDFYRKMSLYGLGIGLPIAALGLTIQAATDFDPSIAIIGEAPNTVATIPVTFGYIGLIVLWNQRPDTWLHHRIRAAGRMALTNYLTQTIIGIIVLRGIFNSDRLSRSWIALFVLAVWGLQLAWSLPWLSRFRFGPFEWAWRCATYRTWQPLRR